MRSELFHHFEPAHNNQFVNQTHSSNNAQNNQSFAPCVRGRSRAAQILSQAPMKDLNRKNSLQSATSYASSSSWTSQNHPRAKTLLPSELPYLSTSNTSQASKKEDRSSWQSYMDTSLDDRDNSKVGAFFTTLALQYQPMTVVVEKEDQSSDIASSVGLFSDVSSSMSGYSNCNVEDILIWKKLEKALETKIQSTSKDNVENNTSTYRQKEIHPALQIGQSQSSRQNLIRLSEPPKTPIPPVLAPRPATLLYQYQRVTAAGSAAKHRRIRSGTER